ncbi:choloylglycine hydrolase family protein [Maridesulfovibrio sp.]|uniref:choloylglycine hydrolase family protein n=1 Tax=Maridesulfovibrio sp. TaxID=2795000 RepID=UPI0029F52C38|nr:choloylglycine hydrolase family protein [Maridesulfovibrio sp.]
MMPILKLFSILAMVVLILTYIGGSALACTGVRLVTEDSSTVYGRTMEWGAFDLHSRIVIVPSGQSFTGLVPDGMQGKKWKSKYGFVGIDMLKKDFFADAMNEKGLAAGLFYHPGYASFPEYRKSQADNSISSGDVVTYIVSQFATIDEVKTGMENVRVVGVVEGSLGKSIEAHWMITEQSGKSIVIEYADGKMKIFENPLGVLTNAPTFDWHMTNLRNYINVSPVAVPAKKLSKVNFAPLGGGSGMIGLPGDFTPPSRFVRVVAWSQTARPLPNAVEGVYETFRILDNFNVPLGAAEGSDNAGKEEGLRSATLWTTAWDLQNKKLFYHTQHNRKVRTVDLSRIDFSPKGKVIKFAMDKKNDQNFEDVTP